MMHVTLRDLLGTYTAPTAFGRALPGSFHGVLDFACCNSSVLATHVRDVCGDHFRILYNPGRLLPIAVFHLVREVLEASASSDKSYLHWKPELEHALHASLSEAAR